jgi:hypothetical protein
VDCLVIGSHFRIGSNNHVLTVPLQSSTCIGRIRLGYDIRLIFLRQHRRDPHVIVIPMLNSRGQLVFQFNHRRDFSGLFQLNASSSSHGGGFLIICLLRDSRRVLLLPAGRVALLHPLHSVGLVDGDQGMITYSSASLPIESTA